MDSNKDRPCKIFAIVMLGIYFQLATAINIDCGGKPFHCVNATHFMICVDLGAGVSKTVDDIMIQCPTLTVCRITNYFECEYLVSTTTKSTIRSGDKTNDFTIDTQETTTFSNDITTTISPFQKTRVSRLFNEYTTDVTTQADYVLDIRPNKQNDTAETREISATTKDKTSISNEHSNFLTATTESESEILLSKFPEIITHNNSSNSIRLLISPDSENLFQNDSILPFSTKSEDTLSKRVFDDNITRAVTDINILNITDLSGDSSMTNPMNTFFHDTITEITSKDEFTLREQEVTSSLNEADSITELTIQNRQRESTDTTYNQNVPTTQTTVFNQYPMVPNNSYLENTSSTLISLNRTQLTKSVTHVSEFNGLQDNENRIEITSEFNLLGQIELDKTTETLSSYEPNILDITKDKLTTNADTLNSLFGTISFPIVTTTLEPTNTPIKDITDTEPIRESSTIPTDYLSYNELLLFRYENKTVIYPELEFTSTVLNPTTLQHEESDDFTSIFDTNKVNMTFTFDYKPLESVTAAPVVNLIETNVEDKSRKNITTSSIALDIKKLPPDDDVLKLAPTIITENSNIIHTTSSVEYRSNKNTLNVLEEVIQEKKGNTADLPEATLSEDIYTTQANIPDVLVNTTYLLTKNNVTTTSSVTTLGSTTKSMEYVRDEKQGAERSTISSDDMGNNMFFLEMSVTSTIINSIPLSYDASDIDKIATTEVRMTSELDNNYSSDKITTTTPDLYIIDQKNQIITERPHIFIKTEDQILPPQEKINIIPLVVTKYPYYEDRSFKIDNKTSGSNVHLIDQIIQANSESTPSLPEISTTNTNMRNASVNNELVLSNDYFTTLPSPLKLPITNIEPTQNTTVPCDKLNTNGTFLLQQEYITEISMEEAENTTPADLISLDNNVIETLDYSVTEKYDDMINKTILMYVSSNSTPRLENQKSSSVNVSASIETTLQVVETLNNVSEFEVTQDGLTKKTETPSTNLNTNATFLLQDRQHKTISWLDVIVASTKKPISKNSTLNLNLITIDSSYGQDNMVEVSTEVTSSSGNIKNNETIPAMLQHGKSWEILLPTVADKLITEKNIKNYVTSDQINYMDQITTSLKFNDISKTKYVTEATSENQQEMSNTKIVTSHDQLDTNTEVLVTNHINVPITSDALITNVASKIDQLNSTRKHFITEVTTDRYFNLSRRENLNDMVQINVNQESHNKSIQVRNKKNLDIPNFINDTVFTTNTGPIGQKLVGKKIITVTENNFKVMNRVDSTNATNINLFEKLDVVYPSSNNILIQKFEAFASSNAKKEQNINTTEVPLSNIENIDFTNITAEKPIPNNVINNLNNNQLTIPIINFPELNDFKSRSINNDDVTHTSNTVTKEPMSYSDIISFHTIYHNNTKDIFDINNYNLTYNQLNITKDGISNKTTMMTNTASTSNNFYINQFTDNKENTPFTGKSVPVSTTPYVISEPINNTDAIKSNSQFVIEDTDHLYDKNNRVKNILQENNTLKSIYNTNNETSEQIIDNVNIKADINIYNDNSTSNSHIPTTPIKYLDFITTEPNQKSLLPVLLKAVKPSFDKNLSEIIQKRGHGLNNTHESDYRLVTPQGINKNENNPINPSVPHNINKKNPVKRNLQETKSWNSTNVGIKVTHSSLPPISFTCKYQLRGRYADKNDCRKFYICMGTNQALLGECPINTVFSEIKKQCTKNLSHCIVNNQFRCIQEGRFSDVLQSQIYYICVNNSNTYIRFKFQCQNGYHLNKRSVRCVNNSKPEFQMSSTSTDNDSNRGSDPSTSKERKQTKENTKKHICTQEGKFPDVDDCRKYYVCSKNSKSIFRRRTKKCDSEEVFHREKKKCVDRDSYECN